MDYKEQILESYNKLGFTPRDKQLENINSILHAFLDDGFSTIVLSAPTGTGKSIIGAVVAETLHQMEKPGVHAGASFLLTPTNILSDQYHDTFQKGKSPFDTTFRMIKGANNFECTALSTEAEPQTAEACAGRLFFKEEMSHITDHHCNRCAFSQQKKMRDKTRHLITDYSYYFFDRMYTGILAKRTSCVFDEAHLLNDLFCEHNTIFFSNSRLTTMAKEIVDNLSLGNTEIFKTFKKIKEDLNAKKINEDNYPEYLKELSDAYKLVFERAQTRAEHEIHNPKKYLTLSKLAKKYFNLGCKINDLFIYGYPHAFEFNEENPKDARSENEVNVKPIFVGDMFSTLINAKYNLLMSATISKAYVSRTITLGDKWTHMRLDPTFPKENKKIIFYKPQDLNYSTLKNEKVVSNLQDTCLEIVRHHEDKNERGILLAPSFNLIDNISKHLKSNDVRTKLFEQKRGENLAETVEKFKAYSKGPALLLTPAGFEGLDLSGELSRYQVILKAPFASLAEARMKKIIASWPDIYSLMALMKLVQGAGRSVRGPDDWATTYMLDANIKRLWTARNMEWADEFLTMYKSDLGSLEDE